MFILNEKSQLIHFIKESDKSFADSFLLGIKQEYKGWCAFANHGSKVDENCYLIKQYESGWMEYLRHFVVVARYLLADSQREQYLERLVDVLTNPQLNLSKKKFEYNLNQLLAVVNGIERDIKLTAKKLTCLESERLGEAISCLMSSCFVSAVVMAASAVEARLHYLIKKKNAGIYKKHFSEKPLGTLIKLFDDSEYKANEFISLKKILPMKHKSLLDLINTYRIFSAHPKGEKIDYRSGETIINLSFIFLFDHGLGITDKKLLVHE